MPMHPRSAAERDEVVHDAPRRRPLRVRSSSTNRSVTTPRRSPERSGSISDGAEAEHDVVDGADDEQRVVACEQRAVRVGERFGPRFALEPDRAALHHRQLRAHHVRKLDDPRDVVLAGGPAGFHVR